MDGWGKRPYYSSSPYDEPSQKQNRTTGPSNTQYQPRLGNNQNQNRSYNEPYHNGRQTTGSRPTGNRDPFSSSRPFQDSYKSPTSFQARTPLQGGATRFPNLSTQQRPSPSLFQSLVSPPPPPPPPLSLPSLMSLPSGMRSAARPGVSSMGGPVTPHGPSAKRSGFSSMGGPVTSSGPSPNRPRFSSMGGSVASTGPSLRQEFSSVGGPVTSSGPSPNRPRFSSMGGSVASTGPSLRQEFSSVGGPVTSGGSSPTRPVYPSVGDPVSPSGPPTAVSNPPATYIVRLHNLKPNLVYVELPCEGPAHQRIFKTTIEMDGVTYEGSGSSKQKAKSEAAQQVLVAIDAMNPPIVASENTSAQLSPVGELSKKIDEDSNVKETEEISSVSPPSKTSVTGSQSGGSTTEVSTSGIPSANVVSPSSNLSEDGSKPPTTSTKHPMMVLNEMHPGCSNLFEIVSEKGPANAKEFTMKITFKGESFFGTAANKKKAKELATIAALAKLDNIHFSQPIVTPPVSIGFNESTDLSAPFPVSKHITPTSPVVPVKCRTTTFPSQTINSEKFISYPKPPYPSFRSTPRKVDTPIPNALLSKLLELSGTSSTNNTVQPPRFASVPPQRGRGGNYRGNMPGRNPGGIRPMRPQKRFEPEGVRGGYGYNQSYTSQNQW